MQVIFDRAYVGATCGTVLAVEADRVKIRDNYGCEIHCRLDDVYANEKDYEKNPVILLTITRNLSRM